mmetsp:Transcript_90978/g.262267  ORF Transcript_90978/g.262267 Transcript_90978/m.262267 type:complete len:212 (+) Transcript_90978:2057-2692(+)
MPIQTRSGAPQHRSGGGDDALQAPASERRTWRVSSRRRPGRSAARPSQPAGSAGRLQTPLLRLEMGPTGSLTRSLTKAPSGQRGMKRIRSWRRPRRSAKFLRRQAARAGRLLTPPLRMETAPMRTFSHILAKASTSLLGMEAGPASSLTISTEMRSRSSLRIPLTRPRAISQRLRSAHLGGKRPYRPKETLLRPSLMMGIRRALRSSLLIA